VSADAPEKHAAPTARTRVDRAATHAGTCAVCEGTFRVRDGVVALHGYRRPGDGTARGRCFGALRLAWEIAPDAARVYLADVLVPHRDALAGALADCDAGRVAMVQRNRRVRRAGQHPTEWITPEHPDWPAVLAVHRSHAERDLQRAEAVVARCEARLAAWVAAPLRPLQRGATGLGGGDAGR
jgi:hypothetical protein